MLRVGSGLRSATQRAEKFRPEARLMTPGTTVNSVELPIASSLGMQLPMQLSTRPYLVLRTAGPKTRSSRDLRLSPLVPEPPKATSDPRILHHHRFPHLDSLGLPLGKQSTPIHHSFLLMLDVCAGTTPPIIRRRITTLTTSKKSPSICGSPKTHFRNSI
jgi:hypothetical protein